MKKNILFLIALIFVATTFTGCFSIDRAKIPNSEKDHLLVGNYGWYLFHFVPLVCGNASTHATCPFVIFRNDVTMDKIQNRFMMRANSLDKTDKRELTYTTQESVLFEIPGLGLPIPIPYILTYREIQLSGTIEKEEIKE